MSNVITILGWFTLIFFSSIILAIAGKMVFDAATVDYKSYQRLRIFRKRLLRKRYEMLSDRRIITDSEIFFSNTVEIRATLY